jgi:hypothetical protein
MPYSHLPHMDVMVYCYDCNWLVCMNCFQMTSERHRKHRYDIG